MRKPLVSVCMITYNHEAYIQQAIESVLMQTSDFKFELIIANDASKDQTHTIIKNIIDTHTKGSCICYYNHISNLGMMPNFMFAIKQCKGKYVALCEGDDYWTDPLKLQKQVDFLESNVEFSFCGHKSYVLKNNIFKKIVLNMEILTFKELVFKNRLTTSSLMFREKNIYSFPDFFYSISAGDWGLQLLAIKDSKAYILKDYMSVYREHEKGIWSNLDNQTKCMQGVHLINSFKQIYSDENSIRLINIAIKERKNSFGIKNQNYFEFVFQKAKKIIKNLKS